MTNERQQYFTELLRLRCGRQPTMLDLEGLHEDAVRAAEVLDLALEEFDDRKPDMPADMVGCSIEHLGVILYAMRNLLHAVQLAERGWHVVYEAERVEKDLADPKFRAAEWRYTGLDRG